MPALGSSGQLSAAVTSYSVPFFLACLTTITGSAAATQYKTREHHVRIVRVLSFNHPKPS